ncbi:MAG: hypothetical protein FWE23_02380 [Chitinivibrionia bacterium]|nr:hypothetical protein [Chitinivibrionia bacterium]
MRKYLLVFLISSTLAILTPFAFWLLARIKDMGSFIDYLTKTGFSDYLVMSGASFFVIGMIISLAATSRWHYYRHLRSKFKGEIQDDTEFEAKEKKRKVQMWYGIMITISGIIVFALSGYLALRTVI